MEESMSGRLEDTTVGKKANLPLTLLALAVITLTAGAYWYLRPAQVPLTESNPTTTPATDSLTTKESPSNAMPERDVKVFTLDAGMFFFKPNVIQVKKGDKVKVVINNTDSNDKFEVMHDFAIDELEVLSEEIGEGESGSVEFTANTVGEFEFYCSVGEHRKKGQVGTFIVTE